MWNFLVFGGEITHKLCFEQVYEKYQIFLSEIFSLFSAFEVKFSMYLNRRVFVLFNYPRVIYADVNCKMLLVLFRFICNDIVSNKFATWIYFWYPVAQPSLTYMYNMATTKFALNKMVKSTRYVYWRNANSDFLFHISCTANSMQVLDIILSNFRALCNKNCLLSFYNNRYINF